MRKRIIYLLVVFLLLLSLYIPVLASMESVRVYPSLSFNGTTASCNAWIIEPSQIQATLELWQGNSLVASWSGSQYGALQIGGTVTVSHGLAYTLIVSGTVGGETISSMPVTKICP